MEQLRSHSTVCRAPEKAGMRRQLLIVTPRLVLGTLKNAGVM